MQEGSLKKEKNPLEEGCVWKHAKKESGESEVLYVANDRIEKYGE